MHLHLQQTVNVSVAKTCWRHKLLLRPISCEFLYCFSRTLDLKKAELDEVPCSILRLEKLQAIRLDGNKSLCDVTILAAVGTLRVVVLKNCCLKR